MAINGSLQILELLDDDERGSAHGGFAQIFHAGLCLGHCIHHNIVERAASSGDGTVILVVNSTQIASIAL